VDFVHGRIAHDNVHVLLLARAASARMHRRGAIVRFPGIKFYGLRGTEVMTFDDITAYSAWKVERADPLGDVVKQETIGNAWISTVLLMIDHQFGEGPPLIFETMVFDAESHEPMDRMQRYSTYDEALAGHEEIANCMRLIDRESERITETALRIIKAGITKGDNFE
jgi:hypothetical protein